MKTTTMSSLTPVAPAFAESEMLPARTSLEKRRPGTVASFLALFGVVALGFTVIGQAPAVAREMAAAKSSLYHAVHDACRGYGGVGASAACLPDQFSAQQLQQPFPTACEWELAGMRPL